MIYIGHTQSVMIIADKNKLLRLKSDIYKAATETEEEHIPYRTDVVYLPKNITEEQAKEMYAEEDA